MAFPDEQLGFSRGKQGFSHSCDLPLGCRVENAERGPWPLSNPEAV